MDPERDTPEVLKRYAEGHKANPAGWAFFTGTAAEIRDVAKRYGIYYKKMPRGDVDHTFLTSLVDQSGTLRVQYMGVSSIRMRCSETYEACYGRSRPGEGLAARLVARVPAKLHAKLLIGFLAITVLLIALGAVGLQALNNTNQRAKDLVELQRKIAAYRQLQHDTTAQLYSVASALLVHDERTFDATLRQLNQFGYDLDRLQFVAKDEVELLGQVRKEYDQFIQVVSRPSS